MLNNLQFGLDHKIYGSTAGGLSGKGLMAGKQKLFYLPEPHTDFIFAVICEESGLIGARHAVVLRRDRVARIAYRAARAGSVRLVLALGLTMMIGVQAFVNISVVLGLMPTKGIPLPLVSAGGSSLLINLLAWACC